MHETSMFSFSPKVFFPLDCIKKKEKKLHGERFSMGCEQILTFFFTLQVSLLKPIETEVGKKRPGTGDGGPDAKKPMSK